MSNLYNQNSYHNNRPKEILLNIQISMRIPLSTTSNIGNLKESAINFLRSIPSDDMSIMINDFDLNDINKMSVTKTIEYYKSNSFNLKYTPNKAIQNNLLKLDDLTGTHNNQKLRNTELKDSILTKDQSNRAYSSNRKTVQNNNDSKNIKNNDLELREFKGRNRRSGSNAFDNDCTNADSYYNIKDLITSENVKKSLVKSKQDQNIHHRLYKYIEDLANEINKNTILKSLSIDNKLEKITEELDSLIQENNENIFKKEKLKKKLYENQNFINELKEDLNEISNRNSELEAELKEINSVLNNERAKIQKLKPKLAHYKDFNSKLGLNLKHYENYVKELNETISILKNNNNNDIQLNTESDQKNECTCDLKDKEIELLKKLNFEVDSYNDESNDYKVENLKRMIINKDIIIESLKISENNLNKLLLKSKQAYTTLKNEFKNKNVTFPKEFEEFCTQSNNNINQISNKIDSINSGNHAIVQKLETISINMDVNNKLNEIKEIQENRVNEIIKSKEQLIETLNNKLSLIDEYVQKTKNENERLLEDIKKVMDKNDNMRNEFEKKNSDLVQEISRLNSQNEIIVKEKDKYYSEMLLEKDKYYSTKLEEKDKLMNEKIKEINSIMELKLLEKEDHNKDFIKILELNFNEKIKSKELLYQERIKYKDNLFQDKNKEYEKIVLEKNQTIELLNDKIKKIEENNSLEIDSLEKNFTQKLKLNEIESNNKLNEIQKTLDDERTKQLNELIVQNNLNLKKIEDEYQKNSLENEKKHIDEIKFLNERNIKNIEEKEISMNEKIFEIQNKFYKEITQKTNLIEELMNEIVVLKSRLNEDQKLFSIKVTEIENSKKETIIKLEKDYQEKISNLENGYRLKIEEIEASNNQHIKELKDSFELKNEGLLLEKIKEIEEINKYYKNEMAEIKKIHLNELIENTQKTNLEINQTKDFYEKEIIRLNQNFRTNIEETTIKINLRQKENIEEIKSEFEDSLKIFRLKIEELDEFYKFEIDKINNSNKELHLIYINTLESIENDKKKFEIDYLNSIQILKNEIEEKVISLEKLNSAFEEKQKNSELEFEKKISELINTNETDKKAINNECENKINGLKSFYENQIEDLKKDNIRKIIEKDNEYNLKKIEEATLLNEKIQQIENDFKIKIILKNDENESKIKNLELINQNKILEIENNYKENLSQVQLECEEKIKKIEELNFEKIQEINLIKEKEIEEKLNLLKNLMEIETEKKLKENENLMNSKICEIELKYNLEIKANLSEYDKSMSEKEKSYEELILKNNNKYSEEINHLKETQLKEINDLNKLNEEKFLNFEGLKQKEIENLNEKFTSEIGKININMQSIKDFYSNEKILLYEEIENLKLKHTENFKSMKEKYESEINELKISLDKYNFIHENSENSLKDEIFIYAGIVEKKEKELVQLKMEIYELKNLLNETLDNNKKEKIKNSKIFNDEKTELKKKYEEIIENTIKDQKNEKSELERTYNEVSEKKQKDFDIKFNETVKLYEEKIEIQQNILKNELLEMEKSYQEKLKHQQDEFNTKFSENIKLWEDKLIIIKFEDERKHSDTITSYEEKISSQESKFNSKLSENIKFYEEKIKIQQEEFDHKISEITKNNHEKTESQKFEYEDKIKETNLIYEEKLRLVNSEKNKNSIRYSLTLISNSKKLHELEKLNKNLVEKINEISEVNQMLEDKINLNKFVQIYQFESFTIFPFIPNFNISNNINIFIEKEKSFLYFRPIISDYFWIHSPVRKPLLKTTYDLKILTKKIKYEMIIENVIKIIFCATKKQLLVNSNFFNIICKSEKIERLTNEISDLKAEIHLLQHDKLENIKIVENLHKSKDEILAENIKLHNQIYKKNLIAESDSIENKLKEKSQILIDYQTELKNYEIKCETLIQDNFQLKVLLNEIKVNLEKVENDNKTLINNSNEPNLLAKYKSLVNHYKELEKRLSKLNIKEDSIKEISISEESVDKSRDEGTIFEGNSNIYSVYDSKRILKFNLENRIFSLIEFKDFGDFEENFNPNGSMFLNIVEGLLIVTGHNHDRFYFYCIDKNQMNKLPNLSHNHSYGSLLFNEKENSVICISGWHNKMVEKYLNLEFTYNFIKDRPLILTKKFDIKNKNTWAPMPEMSIERSECANIILNNTYLYSFFGFNCPQMEYLDSVERLNLDTQLSWELVKIMNENNASLFRKNHSLISIKDRLVFIGGYDGKNDKIIENLGILDLAEMKFEENKRNLPDIKKNHFYNFQKNTGFTLLKQNDRYVYLGIDEKDNIHYIDSESLQYDIYKFES